MPRPKMFRRPLDKELPRVRVSTMTYKAVKAAADRHNISISDLVRACIAYVLGWPNENSELIARMIKDAVPSLETLEGVENEET